MTASASTASATLPKFAALHVPGYRRYFLLSLMAMMADNIEHVISYWVIYLKFHSPRAGGLRRDQPLGAVPALLGVRGRARRSLRLPQADPGG